MNAKQKKAATDRLAAAREARFAKNPPQYKQYCAAVVALPEDHDFSMKNVRAWIKEAKVHKTAEHRSHVAGTAGALVADVLGHGVLGFLLASQEVIVPAARSRLEHSGTARRS